MDQGTFFEETQFHVKISDEICVPKLFDTSWQYDGVQIAFYGSSSQIENVLIRKQMETYTFPAHSDAQNHPRDREGERESITFSCTVKVEVV